MAVAKKTFEFFFNRLVKGFIKDQKRQPNNLEMILIKQEAGQKAIDANKVIEVDFDPKNTWKDKKGITSLMKSGDVKVGKAPKTPPYEKSQADIEFEIMEKIKTDNEKAIRGFESRNPNPKKAGKGRFTKAEYLIQRLRNTIRDNPDDKYVQETFPGFIKELEANPDLAKNENVFNSLGELPKNQKITVYDDDTLDFATLQPTKKFRLNKEKFKQDFNVSDDEVERITKLSSEDQRKVLQDYIDKDFGQQIKLSDFDVTDLEPNAEGGRAGYYTGGMTDVKPDLSDIGHGSDSLMARTRLMSPGSQATTSTGLNYLLAEDNDNIRVPFANGYGVKDHQAYIKQMDADLLKHFKRYKKIYGGKMNMKQFAPKFIKEYAEGGRIGFQGGGMGRRTFLKLLATLGGGLAAAKSGILSLGTKGAVKKALPAITTPSAPGKPEWFDALVTRVIREGDDVTKKFATKEREIVHRKKIDDETEVIVTQDLDNSVTRIDIDDSTRNVMGYDDPPTVSLQVTDEIVEEGGQRIKPKFEATENDYRNYATDPDGGYETEFVENTVENTKDLTSDLTKIKSFATNKKETMKEFVESKKRKDNVKYANENPSAYAADRGPDYDPSDYIDDMADDFASGGIARMIGE